MFYAKLTKKEKQEKLGRLQKIRREMESEEQTKIMIEAWKEFLALPYQEQQRIRKEWDEYYAKVRTSVIYEIFTAQREASALGDWKKVKELAETAKQMRINGDHITIAKPMSFDPNEFDHGSIINEHKRLNRDIANLTKVDNAESNFQGQSVYY